MNIINKTIYNNLELLPKDISGWNGNSIVFKNLIEQINPNIIIEVGTWKGQSAINMGNILKKNNINGTIYCVDTWLGAIEFWTTMSYTEDRFLLQKNGFPQIYYQFLSNVVHENLEDYILPFPNTSENGYRYFKHSNIKSQLIYIDASHEEDDVYKDISNYYELLDTNGVLFGDDYTNWIGVKKSVDRFVNEKHLNLRIFENNFWIIEK